MPAKSKSQQKAAGAALSAKRGDTKVSDLQGASKSMYKSMSENQLEEMASTKRKGKKEHRADRRRAARRPRPARGRRRAGATPPPSACPRCPRRPSCRASGGSPTVRARWRPRRAAAGDARSDRGCAPEAGRALVSSGRSASGAYPRSMLAGMPIVTTIRAERALRCPIGKPLER